MNMKKLKKYLIYTHRYLGLAFCLIFALWFISGVIMMYKRMPRLSAEERLMRLSALDFSRAALTPEQAYQRLGWSGAPGKVRLGMFNGRPVYRFFSDRGWATIFADDGGRLEPVTPAQGLEIVGAFVPEHHGGVKYIEKIEVADQWTLSGALRWFKPLHKFALDDEPGTHLYVSQVTGEVVMKTTRASRFWGWIGAVIHWIYFTPLRQRPDLWHDVIVYGSGAGCVLCLSGIVAGLWRYRFRKQYRLRGELRCTPYVGLMRWHHYFGLFFGLITFTWILSGLFSMNPGKWSPGSSPTEAQINAVAGGALDPRLFKLSPAEALREFQIEFQPKEIELAQFRGRPYYLALQSPDQLKTGSNTDPAAVLSAEAPLPHLLIAADETKTRLHEFAREEVMTAAREAMPGVGIRDAAWLDRYDAYYYHRARGRRLPVLRVKYDDPQQTWLYLDPQLGAVVQKEEARSRIERWLYNGLHSLDFPYLYQSRPAWDLTVIALSLGGCVLSLTAVWLSWRRTARNLKRRRAFRPAVVPGQDDLQPSPISISNRES
jgi:PepSY-associated TM region